MKSIIIHILFLGIASNCFTQSMDSIIYRSENILLTKNLETANYRFVVGDETYDELKFVKQIYSYFQILDGNNNIYYVGEDGVKKERVHDFLGLCGTVPHYTLSIKQTASHFEIFEDETFYDYNNQSPAEKIHQISVLEADSILFVNGKSEFKFTANFSEGIAFTDPRMLILVKDGKYFSRDNPDLKYDSIDFTDFNQVIKTRKIDHYGLLGIAEPKYKRIEEFNFYLAKAETATGDIVYIDLEGNEYKPTAIGQGDDYSKDKIFGTYHSSDWLCSTTLILHEDGQYFYESGCEGRSSVDYGIWSIKNDTLSLNRQNFNDSTFSPIRKIIHEPIDSDSSFISIYDIYGDNITESQSLNLTESKTGSTYFLNWMNILSGFHNEAIVKSTVSVSGEKYKISQLLPARIELPNITSIAPDKHLVLIDKFKHTKIYLNLPSKLISMWEIEHLDQTIEIRKYLVKDDGLYINEELSLGKK